MLQLADPRPRPQHSQSTSSLWQTAHLSEGKTGSNGAEKLEKYQPRTELTQSERCDCHSEETAQGALGALTGGPARRANRLLFHADISTEHPLSQTLSLAKACCSSPWV